MKLSDIRVRPGTWRHIESLLAAGGEPKLDDLLKALRDERAIPPKATAYIESLLKGRQRRQGRKKTPKGEYPSSHALVQDNRKALEEIKLVYAVRDAAENFAGESDPTEAAIGSVAVARHIDPATLRRYYLRALKSFPPETDEI
jgi:hypothetical protein